MEAALLELAKNITLNSMDAVLGIQVISICILVVKSRKGDTKSEVTGIRWIGILGLSTIVTRLIIYFGDKHA